jgi:adhesin/invasin
LIVNPTKVSADGSSTISVTAIVRDEFGNTVAGQQVTFSATAGTIGDTAQTDSNGSAVTQLVAPKTQGTANVTASVGGLVQSAQVEFEKAQIFIPNLWGN